MSDYLTRLVERELGVAPLVKPRIAPRFATGPEILENLEHDPLQELPDEGAPSCEDGRLDRGFPGSLPRRS